MKRGKFVGFTKVLTALALGLVLSLLPIMSSPASLAEAQETDIQVLIDNAPNGGWIQLEYGRYDIGETLVIPSGKSIKISGVGRGTELYCDKPIGDMIYVEPAAYKPDGRPSWGYPPFENDNVEICDLTLIADNAENEEVIGIHIFKRHNASLHNLFGFGTDLVGIKGEFLNNSSITDINFAKVRKGVVLDTDIDDVLVSGVNVQYAQDVGMYFANGHKLSVIGCAIEEATNYGMYFDNVYNSIIDSNIITETYYGTNLRFYTKCDSNIVSNNQLFDAGTKQPNQWAGMRVGGNCDKNMIIGNYSGKFYGDYQMYGIEIQSGAYDNQLVTNLFLGNLGADILDNGTGTIIHQLDGAGVE